MDGAKIRNSISISKSDPALLRASNRIRFRNSLPTNRFPKKAVCPSCPQPLSLTREKFYDFDVPTSLAGVCAAVRRIENCFVVKKRNGKAKKKMAFVEKLDLQGIDFKRKLNFCTHIYFLFLFQ
ncbi:hypothetical protein CEXT_83551 [Caerostris extrusa]|uniref:Uncharacterized protein n=1 Tax=Caerostris extrusa TaxID=172846 RepID=A0AAV4PRA5_CAEEX|nr:hypothetical protein CEXT_83551 [Caerostris extrusa]